MIGDFNVGNDNAKVMIWSVNLCVGDQCLSVSRKTFRFSHKMICCLLKNTYYVLLASLKYARFSDAPARGPSPTSRYFLLLLLLCYCYSCLPACRFLLRADEWLCTRPWGGVVMRPWAGSPGVGIAAAGSVLPLAMMNVIERVCLSLAVSDRCIVTGRCVYLLPTVDGLQMPSADGVE